MLQKLLTGSVITHSLILKLRMPMVSSKEQQISTALLPLQSLYPVEDLFGSPKLDGLILERNQVKLWHLSQMQKLIGNQWDVRCSGIETHGGTLWRMQTRHQQTFLLALRLVVAIRPSSTSHVLVHLCLPANLLHNLQHSHQHNPQHSHQCSHQRSRRRSRQWNLRCNLLFKVHHNLQYRL